MYGWNKAFDFDIDKAHCSHNPTPAILAGQEILVDEKLKDMLERINSTELGMITFMSCQYNTFGFAGISFSYIGFYHLMEFLRTKHIEKYNNTEYKPDSLYSAIAHLNGDKFFTMIGNTNMSQFTYHDTMIAKFNASVGEVDTETESVMNIFITMQIHPKLINYFVELWDKLIVPTKTKID